METDKCNSSCDSYTEIQGNEKEVAKFTDDILDGKLKMVISTKPVPKTPVKLTKKNLKTFRIS